MESTKGWCMWEVSHDYLLKAMSQLDKAGVDMSTVKIAPGVCHKYMFLVYRNGPSLSEER